MKNYVEGIIYVGLMKNYVEGIIYVGLMKNYVNNKMLKIYPDN